MKEIIIGIDIGGSATKIVGFKEGRLIGTVLVKAEDPITSLYGGFGKFISLYGLSISNVSRVMITGVGSSFVKEPIYGIKTGRVHEFNAIGLGGLYLSGLERSIVVSMGTGTAFIRAEGRSFSHAGGTGVGGGMLLGLSGLMLGVRNFDTIIEMANSGDLNMVDLNIGKIMKGGFLDMPPETTAANFGDVQDNVQKEDIALGIINLIFQSIGMMAIFVSRADNLRDIVLTGNLTAINKARGLFGALEDLHKVNFHIPEHAQFATSVGAALAYINQTEYEDI